MSFQWAFLHLINMSLSAKHPPPPTPPPTTTTTRAQSPQTEEQAKHLLHSIRRKGRVCKKNKELPLVYLSSLLCRMRCDISTAYVLERAL
jgi:hypothetical protein